MGYDGDSALFLKGLAILRNFLGSLDVAFGGLEAELRGLAEGGLLVSCLSGSGGTGW